MQPSQAAPLVLVAGGAGGVGEGIVRALLGSTDARVVATSRDPARLALLESRLQANVAPGRLIGIVGNAGDPQGAEAIAHRVREDVGAIDVAIPVAGGLVARRAAARRRPRDVGGGHDGDAAHALRVRAHVRAGARAASRRVVSRDRRRRGVLSGAELRHRLRRRGRAGDAHPRARRRDGRPRRAHHRADRERTRAHARLRDDRRRRLDHRRRRRPRRRRARRYRHDDVARAARTRPAAHHGSRANGRRCRTRTSAYRLARTSRG